MMQPPVLVSVLAPRWWAARQRVRGIAAGGALVGAAAGLYFWLAPAVPALPAAALSGPAPQPAATLFGPPIADRPEPRATEEATIDMAPVLSEGGLRVLLRGDVAEGWVEGAPVVGQDEGITVVTRSLSAAGRAEVKGLVGAHLRLYASDGRSCRASITGVLALGRFEPGGESEPADDPEAAWDTATGSHVIAGDLEILDGDCEEAVWARSESLPPPAVARAGEPTAAVRAAAIRALKSRPEYRELADESGIESEAFEVSTLEIGEHRGETIVATTLLGEGCAGQWPIMTALWRLAPDGRPLFLGSREELTAVLAGADADGDGRIELIGQDDIAGTTLLRRAAGRFRVAQNAPLPILGCRC